ncbi:hypothetical protein MBM_09493 [Drepanopeziza brunnea f. sp. 'multigermtubi' MB_m1]|uniref:CMP/dCMP-type deaminase domain-containing protein n=1 Tax=Marssonina brunnea f. sp. multigermtubi (strain MB_m1) TaxID=1072389 RepID=K1WUL8_MARBU|nr:uncharacterized protein MBM_09493 [Drepanopeziza brunnea f. sp. 'multigermtubi' MB_m1]EKD12318.1 hypothetical protein MBM_09493 [Drepanopeziza brunnea f. sp. 'multigermtubi' MB_m1]
MSRYDSFLSLCLAQADLSPLHYRHGAIIVKGGKVIGQGFNCYRPGFDGGALKSGALPSSSLDGLAIAELKQRLNSKPKCKSKLQNQPDESTFTPFESMGCGHNANVALSMHSEMMAIRSALSLSSGIQASQTSARSAKCFQKPCFKLPGDSKKRKARARGLKAYAKAICEEAEAAAGTGNSFAGKPSLQESPFEAGSSQPGGSVRGQQGQRHGGEQRVSEREGERERGGEHVEKCEQKISQQEVVGQLSVWASPTKKVSIPPRPQQILVTKNKSTSKPNLAARTKDSRLNGSDLYVARLGASNKTPLLKPKVRPSVNPPPLSSPPKSEPSSLYDELSFRSRSAAPSSSSSIPKPEAEPRPEIRASRPCYRCVSAMHAVGIKRVFWTTQGGEWEGAKVRDLVDALEVGAEGDGNEGEGVGTGQESKGVFVTKHEVLMLKRMMGL